MIRQPKPIKRALHSLMALDRTDQTVQVEEISVTCPRLPTAFHGTRIAVVADVHFPDALLSIPELIACVKAQHPDAIFLPGDLTNSYTYFDDTRLAKLAYALSKIAPCFAVSGNHEQRLNREQRYGAILVQNGVQFLNDRYADWAVKGQTLRIFGMCHKRPKPLDVHAQPAIAIAHKPDHFPYYRAARWNLVVCGHAHGGQMRIGTRALYAPGQGFFPTYTGGVYQADGTTMVVSRGLGNSSIPWRIDNRPHLPILILQPK